MSAYQRGYNKVVKLAGLEKTALNERLLRRLLNVEFGDHSWDAKGILQGLRRGEEVPLPDSAPRNVVQGQKEFDGVLLDEYAPVSSLLPQRVREWQKKFSPVREVQPLAEQRYNRLQGEEDRLLSDLFYPRRLPDNLSKKLHEATGGEGPSWRMRVQHIFEEGPSHPLYEELFTQLPDFPQKFTRLDTVSDQVNQVGRFNPPAPGLESISRTWRNRPYDRAGLIDSSNTLTSGRHREDALIPNDKINTVDPQTGEVLGGQGYDPGTVAYRGDAAQGVSYIPPSNPRWVSAHPDVARGYAGNTGQSTLSAYAIDQIPNKHQGPWSRHIAKDSRSFSAEDATNTPLFQGPRTAGWGRSPTYEKVITQKALHPAESHRYKLLPDDRLMRVKGDAATDPLLREG